MFSISKEDEEGNQQRTRRAGIQYAIQYAAPCTYALPAAHRCYQGIVALAVVQYVLAPFLQQNVNDCVEPSRSLSDVMASLFSACQHYCTGTVPSRENESTLQSAAAVPARIFRGRTGVQCHTGRLVYRVPPLLLVSKRAVCRVFLRLQNAHSDLWHRYGQCPSECDDVIKRAHVSRSQRAATSRGH